MAEWLEKEIFKITNILNGLLELHINGLSFEVSYVSPVKKLIKDCIKLEPYQTEAKTCILDGEDALLYLTFRRYNTELVIVWEERHEEKSKSKIEIMTFVYHQFVTDITNWFKENKDEYEKFEAYRDM